MSHPSAPNSLDGLKTAESLFREAVESLPWWQREWRRWRGHDRWLGRIDRALERKDDGFAAECLVVAAGRFPDSPRLQLRAARMAQQAQDVERATRLLRMVEASRQSLVAEIFQAGEIYQTLDRRDDAIRCFERVVQMGPEDIAGASHRYLATIWFNESDYDRSLHHATETVVNGQPITRNSVQQLIQRPLSAPALESARQRLNSVRHESAMMEANRLQVRSYCDLMANDWTAAIEACGEATRKVFEEKHERPRWDSRAEPLPPRFMIIGAMKAGTTSLWQQLMTHPQIVSPLHKELQFFLHPDWPPEYYRAMFPRVSGSKWVTGEASPGYYRTFAWRRILQWYPNIKLIFVRRDPVERTLSHYFHVRSQGLDAMPFDQLPFNGAERIRSLYELDHDELGQVLDDYWERRIALNAYLLLSCQELLLRPWRVQFPPDQLLELEFDDLVSRNGEVIAEVERFIGVTPGKCAPLEPYNVGNYRTDTAEFQTVREALREFFESLEETK